MPRYWSFRDRLVCRVAGHDWEPWQHIRSFARVAPWPGLGTVPMVAESRTCRRRCLLPDAFEARTRFDA